MLLSAAEKALQSATLTDASERHDLLVAVTMSALAVEAFANAVGHLLFPDWEEFESAPTRAKLFLIGRELRLDINKSKVPWQQVFELGKFRNEIVHAKPERVINTDYVTEAERESRRFEIPHSKLEKKLSLKSATRSFGACKAAFDLVAARMPEEVRFEVVANGWSTTHRPE